MSVFRASLPVVVVLVLGGCFLGAEEPGRHPAPEPLPPVTLPDVYKDYELLDGSLSPDGRMALLNPRREVYMGIFPEGKSFEGHLYLVSVSPFKVLSAFPGDFYLWKGGHGGYGFDWAKDGSAALVTQVSKWGVDKVFLVTAHDRKIVDLTGKVRQQVQKDFQASKAVRYNEYFDFIFYDEYQKVDAWSFNEKGEVVDNCICLTDPKDMTDSKDMDKHSWTVRFQGTWNIARASFTKAEWTRLPWGWEIPQYQKKN